MLAIRLLQNHACDDGALVRTARLPTWKMHVASSPKTEMNEDIKDHAVDSKATWCSWSNLVGALILWKINGSHDLQCSLAW